MLFQMRYFLELTYKGTRYAGFQVQANARTVQSEVERALSVLYREEIGCTGSSRTDAGVHARQNFFHFDTEQEIPEGHVYKLNAILPPDIAVRSIRPMPADAHCRFDAISRYYTYRIYTRKDPFLDDRGWFYPFPLDAAVLGETASLVLGTHDFGAFAKRNSQVKTFRCQLMESRWAAVEHGWEYHVRGNRFLRGMVRGLVGTMVRAARGGGGVDAFRAVMASGDNQQADFTAPGHGLMLVEVAYQEGYFR
jgi:tRNA pseudouridine38-40 synthase